MLALDEVLSGQTDLKPPTVQSIRPLQFPSQDVCQF